MEFLRETLNAFYFYFYFGSLTSFGWVGLFQSVTKSIIYSLYTQKYLRNALETLTCVWNAKNKIGYWLLNYKDWYHIYSSFSQR